MPLSRDLALFWGEQAAVRTSTAARVSSAYIKRPLPCYDGKRPSPVAAFDLDLVRFRYDEISFTVSFVVSHDSSKWAKPHIFNFFKLHL